MRGLEPRPVSWECSGPPPHAPGNGPNHSAIWAVLERNTLAKGEDLDDLAAFQADYVEIEVDEPPVLPTLNRIGYNAQIRAQYPRQLAQELERPLLWWVEVWARVWYWIPAKDRVPD